MEEQHDCLDDSEQYTRRTVVEIYGIPQEEGEDVLELVQQVGTALGMTVTSEKLTNACHHLGTIVA